jgi:hypothetical protein
MYSYCDSYECLNKAIHFQILNLYCVKQKGKEILLFFAANLNEDNYWFAQPA